MIHDSEPPLLGVKHWKTLTLSISNWMFTSPCVKPANPEFHDHNGLIALETNQIKYQVWENVKRKSEKLSTTHKNLRNSCSSLFPSSALHSPFFPITPFPSSIALVSPPLLNIPHTTKIYKLYMPHCCTWIASSLIPTLSYVRLVLKKLALDKQGPDCNSWYKYWGSHIPKAHS